MKRALRIAKSSAFGIATVSAMLIALVSYRFLALGVENAMEIVAHNLDGNALFLFAHIAVAPIALALMPFQFMSGLRTRVPSLHRWLGRIYVAAILVSGLAGLQLAFRSTAGIEASIGFALLALLWLGTTAGALLFALRRQFARHRIWMIRSAALTFAAVTLRLYLGLSMALGAEFSVAYPIVAWACWVPNALLVEAYLWFSRLANGNQAQLAS